jgi:hypothetical protein
MHNPLSTNFIRRNIENVKGAKKAMSIERENLKTTTPKKYGGSKNASVDKRVSELEKKLYDVEHNYQQEIIDQLSTIKDDIRLIKSHIFEHKYRSSAKQQTQESQDEEGYFGSKQRMKSQSSEHDSKLAERHLVQSNNKVVGVEELIQVRVKKTHSNYHKNSINLKTISSIIRDYKLEGPDYSTIFYGYSKRNSHPVVVKYSPEGLGHVIEVYDKFWKNIAMAKWPCVNRMLDFKREDSSYIIIERNKSSIAGLPAKAILIDVLKILEFIHDCGFLYRNIEPEHFMLNEEGQLVVIDFKRTKRYVDIKGHPLEVVDSYTGSPFASNNQVRGLSESRKDDLESLGYLALLLLELEIPWFGCSKEQTVKVRSSLTLQ